VRAAIEPVSACAATRRSLGCRPSGDLLFDCSDGKVRIYAADSAYYVDHLDDEGLDYKDGLHYIGTLQCR
jgi:hypothetical protein